MKIKHLKVDFSATFWAVTRASNIQDFEQVIESIKNINVGIWDTLSKIHPKHWSMHAFDRNYKFDHTTNNMTESFNAWLDKIKKLLIIHICKFIRKRLMKRFSNKRKKLLHGSII